MPELRIDIKARFAEFSDSLKKIESDTSRMVGGVSKALKGLGSALTLIGGAAVFGALTRSLTNVAAQFDDLAKKAQGVGVTVEQLSGLRYAADFAGVGVGTLDKGLANLGRRLEEAKDGTGEAVIAFGKLNIDVSKFDNASDLMKVLADRFKDLPDGARKTAIAMQLFGRAGADLVPLLNSGAAGIREMTEEAEALGLIIGTDAAQAAERLNDNMNRIGKAAGALQVYLAGPLINTLADLSDAFIATRKSGKSFIETIEAVFSSNELERAAQAGIEKLQEIADVQAKLDGETSPQRIRRLKDELAILQAQNEAINDRVQALKGTVNESFPQRKQRPQGFNPAGEDSAEQAANAKKLSDGEKLIAQLSRRLEATQNLNEVQKIGLELSRKSSSVSESEAKEAINLATRIDLQKKLNTEKEAQRQLDELIASSTKKASDQLQADIQKVKDLADPFASIARQIQEIEDIAKRAGGAISDDMVQRAINSFSTGDKAVSKFGESLDKTKELSADFWASFQSGAEDAIFEAEKLSDVIKALFQDYAKLFLRQNLFAPLAQAAGIGGSTGTPQQPPAPVENRNNTFTPSSKASLSAQATGSGAGVTINNDLKVTGNGVTIQEVNAAVKRSSRATVQGLQDAEKRGKVLA